MELNKANIKKIILILCVAIAFCIGLINLSSVWSFVMKFLGTLTPIIIGLCIAFVLNPLTSLLEERVLGGISKRFPTKGKNVARGLSIFLSIVMVAGFIALLILLVVPEVEEAFTIISNTLPSAFLKLIDNINAILERFNVEFRIPVGGASDWLQIIENAINYLNEVLDRGALNDLASTALSVVNGFFNFLMGLIFSIYVLAQKERINGFLSRLIRAYSKPRTADRVFRISHLTNTSFRNFVTGQLTEAVIIGMLCFFGMLIFRFPYPTATSAVVGVMALVPVFGAWIGGILGALLCLSDSFTRALLFVLFLVILQQLEGNIIYPKVVGKSVGLPSMLIFVSVIVGASVGGVLGILLSVPLCSIAFVLIKEGVDKRLKKRHIIENLEEMNLVPPDEEDS